MSFLSPLSYFHNGFAADLDTVVDFYNSRFDIKLSWLEKSDLVAFLRSLYHPRDHTSDDAAAEATRPLRIFGRQHRGTGGDRGSPETRNARS